MNGFCGQPLECYILKTLSLHSAPETSLGTLSPLPALDRQQKPVHPATGVAWRHSSTNVSENLNGTHLPMAKDMTIAVTYV